MFVISKDFTFSAAHQLKGLNPDHPCMRLHGHNYIVRVALEAHSLNEHGFVVDFGELNELKVYLRNFFDHRNLNDVMDVQTSTENIAKWLYDWCQKNATWGWMVQSIAVSETPQTWAYYYPTDEDDDEDSGEFVAIIGIVDDPYGVSLN